MKYAILILAGAFMLAVAGELNAQSGQDSDADELETLKRAWEQHRKDTEDEKFPVTGNDLVDKLGEAAGKMRGSERNLSRKDPGAETQKKQEEAIKLLDEIIEQFEEKPGRESESKRDSDKKEKPGSLEKKGREKPGLVDPSRSAEPAQPGLERKQELLRKAGQAEKTPRYGPTGEKPKGWKPGLPGSSTQKELQEGANEKRPPQKAELIDRYFKELLKARPGK
jgi:hypothetical protein